MDDECVLDFTDLNILHVFLFTFSVCAILAEQTLRARYGQQAYVDTSALGAALTF